MTLGGVGGVARMSLNDAAYFEAWGLLNGDVWLTWWGSVREWRVVEHSSDVVDVHKRVGSDIGRGGGQDQCERCPSLAVRTQVVSLGILLGGYGR